MTEPPRKGEADCETPSVLRQNVPVFILPIFALLWIASVGASWLIQWPSDEVGSSHPLMGGNRGSLEVRQQETSSLNSTFSAGHKNYPELICNCSF